MLKYVSKYLSKIKGASEPVKAAFWFTVCSIINKCIQIITVPIFARILSTEEYGQYSIFISWQSILLIISSLNIHSNVFNNGMIKYKDEQKHFLSSMQGLTTVVTIIMLAVFLLFYDGVVAYVGLPGPIIALLLVEIMLTSGYELWAAKQRFDFKYKWIVISTIVLVMLNPIIGLVFVTFSEEKGYARIISVLVVQILIYGIIYIYNIKESKAIFRKEWWLYALGLALPLIPHYLSQTLLNQMDRIMISNMCGNDMAGIYSVAYSGAMILQIVGKSIQSSYTPWIYRRMEEKQTKDIARVANGLIILVGVLNFLLICFAPEVIAILAGEKYKEAIYVIPPVACSAYLIFLYSMFCVIEFYYEMTKPMMIASVMGAGINYLTNRLMIPVFGYYAAGYTTLFCYLLFTVFHYFIMQKALKKNNQEAVYDKKAILIISVFMLLFGNFMSVLYDKLLWRYGLLLLFMIIGIINWKRIKSMCFAVLKRG